MLFRTPLLISPPSFLPSVRSRVRFASGFGYWTQRPQQRVQPAHLQSRLQSMRNMTSCIRPASRVAAGGKDIWYVFHWRVEREDGANSTRRITGQL